MSSSRGTGRVGRIAGGVALRVASHLLPKPFRRVARILGMAQILRGVLQGGGHGGGRPAPARRVKPPIWTRPGQGWQEAEEFARQALNRVGPKAPPTPASARTPKPAPTLPDPPDWPTPAAQTPRAPTPAPSPPAPPPMANWKRAETPEQKAERLERSAAWLAGRKALRVPTRPTALAPGAKRTALAGPGDDGGDVDAASDDPGRPRAPRRPATMLGGRAPTMLGPGGHGGMEGGGKESGGLSQQQRKEWDDVIGKLSDAADKLSKAAERVAETARTGQGRGSPAPTSGGGDGGEGGKPPQGGGGMDDLVRLFALAGEFIG